MPNIKSAVKRVKTTQTAEERNISKKILCVQQLNVRNQLLRQMPITKMN